jgi:hypothetical protein
VFLADPTSDAATSAFVLYPQRVPLGGRSIAESGQQRSGGSRRSSSRTSGACGRTSRSTPACGEDKASADADAAVNETPFASTSDPRFPTDTGEIPSDYQGWQPRLGITWIRAATASRRAAPPASSRRARRVRSGPTCAPPTRDLRHTPAHRRPRPELR